MPELAEIEVVRHYTALSRRNHGVDNGFYPLGSCTMKYNPKINEDVTALPGLAFVHPLQSPETVQGALALMAGLEEALCALTGMARFTLTPAAGAHGELTGLLIIRAFHEANGQPQRRRILVPDTAHGTNPASAAIAGMEVVQIPSSADGGVDLEALRAKLDETVAALMLTNPNTLGLFETRIPAVAEAVHQAGGLLYYDGANLNAIMGLCRPADMGFDVCHLNLHKTFATPHGGGGPGSGPVGVVRKLVPFLPSPLVEKAAGDAYRLVGRRSSIHRQGAFLPRPVRRPGPGLCLYPGHGSRRPPPGFPGRGPQRQLPGQALVRGLRSLPRRAVHARVRAFGQEAERAGHPGPRHRQAPDRLWLPSPTIYFP